MRRLLPTPSTGGHLLVSDALPVISDTEGRPVPLTLKTDKTPTLDSTIPLYGDSTEETGKIPVRGGYVFYDPKGGDGEKPQGWYGKPPLRGRQTTAINHETDAASKGTTGSRRSTARRPENARARLGVG